MCLTGMDCRVEKGHTQPCPLPLQRETLLRQLETNQLDIDATLEELSVQQETEDQNYSMYVSHHLRLRRPSLPSGGGWVPHPVASGPWYPWVPSFGESTIYSQRECPSDVTLVVLSVEQ